VCRAPFAQFREVLLRPWGVAISESVLVSRLGTGLALGARWRIEVFGPQWYARHVGTSSKGFGQCPGCRNQRWAHPIFSCLLFYYLSKPISSGND